MSDELNRVKKLIGDVVEMDYANKVDAIAVVIIDENGGLRTMAAYDAKKRLSVMGGIAFLQYQINNQARPDKSGDV